MESHAGEDGLGQRGVSGHRVRVENGAGDGILAVGLAVCLSWEPVTTTTTSHLTSPPRERLGCSFPLPPSLF